jgi:HAD superfamily hydrolase (TIGR01509 family)
MYDAILFDLDGTLLPMDMKEFTTGYFQLLAQKAALLGYEPHALIDALWHGVAAMVANDGAASNYDRFWERFAAEQGDAVYDHIPLFDDFYANEFDAARRFTQPNPRAPEAVSLARNCAQKVLLATNPLFPRVGVQTRLRWVGLELSSFDDVTTYETSHYCKPNPAYYRELLARNGADPARCLMIGNDANEDILAAQTAGLETYLVTDCRIDAQSRTYQSREGSFAELLEWLYQIS